MENKIKKILNKYLNSDYYEYGFANLSGLLAEEYSMYTHGISVIRKLDDKIIDAIVDGPTQEYYNHYKAINEELTNNAQAIAEAINMSSYKMLAIPATMEDDKLDESYFKTITYNFSHKMVATRAGLGWIGKTDLLISKRFGARVRLVSIITDYPLKVTDQPIDSSLCNECSICSDICPGKAATGLSWNINVYRNKFFDPFKCREYCLSISQKRLNKKISLCGKCVYICPKGRLKNDK